MITEYKTIRTSDFSEIRPLLGDMYMKGDEKFSIKCEQWGKYWNDEKPSKRVITCTTYYYNPEIGNN